MIMPLGPQLCASDWVSRRLAALEDNVEHVPVLITARPLPMLLAGNRYHALIEVPDIAIRGVR
ncbi:hypothetical protein D3227_37245 [Mesorhizobium waimense]|uniref:Uncharacterized protein n=1 Tax=Mesorhizobium waimense TaxID=1300307 RepID=A0A3A5JW00_9HYPH|nr:hypothetical protein D3227_37245 [Mesorhizobium waimense]